MITVKFTGFGYLWRSMPRWLKTEVVSAPQWPAAGRVAGLAPVSDLCEK
ncbi:MAG: hypothetical protein JWM59_976 [Verrucomicrobiales bacterium]|nr:hypothetical protein [Verrucomicrobiales bacterium]